MAAKRKTPMVVEESSSSDEESDIEETPIQQKSIHPVPETPDDESDEDVEEEVEVEEEEDDEEADEEEDDEEEVEEEDEEEKSPAKQPTITTPADTRSVSESGSESDSPSPKASDFTVRPIASKPSKPKSKPKEEEKKKSELVSEENGKKGPGKIWTSDDEITVLEAMVEHQSKKGLVLFQDMGPIHESIEGSLHGEFTKNQFNDKVRRLKKKYHINVSKYPKGVDPVFATAHEGKLFELSKTLWSTDNKNVAINNNNVSSSSNKRKAKELGNGVESVLALPIPDASAKKPNLSPNWGVKLDKEEHVEPIVSRYPYLDEVLESGKGLELQVPMIMRGDSMKEMIGSGSIEASKLCELDQMWKNLMMDEAEHYLKKAALIEEHTRLILNATKNSASSSSGKKSP